MSQLLSEDERLPNTLNHSTLTLSTWKSFQQFWTTYYMTQLHISNRENMYMCVWTDQDTSDTSHHHHWLEQQTLQAKPLLSSMMPHPFPHLMCPTTDSTIWRVIWMNWIFILCKSPTNSGTDLWQWLCNQPSDASTRNLALMDETIIGQISKLLWIVLMRELVLSLNRQF